MAYRMVPLNLLMVNPANDRHGELENETAAIAQLFATQEQHMRNLARDLVSKAEVFEPPLVFPQGDEYIVADGNRRTTCMKLLATLDGLQRSNFSNFLRICGVSGRAVSLIRSNAVSKRIGIESTIFYIGGIPEFRAGSVRVTGMIG